jgi:hypothetical protein
VDKPVNLFRKDRILFCGFGKIPLQGIKKKAEKEIRKISSRLIWFWVKIEAKYPNPKPYIKTESSE